MASAEAHILLQDCLSFTQMRLLGHFVPQGEAVGSTVAQDDRADEIMQIKTVLLMLSLWEG